MGAIALIHPQAPLPPSCHPPHADCRHSMLDLPRHRNELDYEKQNYEQPEVGCTAA